MPRFTGGKQGWIAKVEPPVDQARKIYTDDHRDAPKGFGLAVYRTGVKSFVLRYTVDGRRRLKVIGEWGVWSLDAARLEAKDILRGLHHGTDPLETRQLRRAEMTISSFSKEWLDKFATGQKSEHDIRKYIADVAGELGHMKISDVRRRDFIELVEKKAVTAPRAAALLLQYTRQMLAYATNKELIPANPLAGLKAREIIVAGRKNALAPVTRRRVLDDEELRSFWSNIETPKLHKLTSLTLKLLLVTGQRPSEVAHLHPSEIDGRIWTIPATRRLKSETETRVYLTDLALEIIAKASAETDRLGRHKDSSSSGHLFEAKVGAPISNATLAKAVTRNAKELGIKEVAHWGRWTPHDLRRTMRTGLSACKIRPDIAELAIGHHKQGNLAVYDQHEYEQEIQFAFEAWERRLLSIVSNTQQSDVIALEVVN